MKKLKIALIAVLAAIVVIAVAVAFLTAPMGKKYVNTHGEELIGRKINIEDFRLNILTGNVNLDNVTIYERNGDSTFVSVDDIDLNLSMLDLLRGKINIEKLSVDDAVVNVVQKGGAFNFDDFTQSLSEGESSEYTIGKLRFSDIEINYLDLTEPSVPFAYSIHDMSVKADSFSTNGTCRFDIECELGTDGEAEVTYIGSISDQNNLSMTINLEDVNLKDFSPMFVQLFGREVTDGELNLQSDITINNGWVEGTNHILIEDPKVNKIKGLSFKPEFRHLPLKTCLYIMTDKHGKCELDLPVSGNASSPSFSYKRTLLRTLGRFMTKITTFGHKNLDEED